MRNAARTLMAMLMVLLIGSPAWAGFSVDQRPTEVQADPGDIWQIGMSLEVDDGDIAGFVPSLWVVGSPDEEYDTDAFSREDPNDPAMPEYDPDLLPGLLFSLDDGDNGPGVGLPDRITELFFAPFPFAGVHWFTNAIETFLGLGTNPPATERDDDVDAYESRRVMGNEIPVFFSGDADAPAWLDPGDIYMSLPYGPPPSFLYCDDVTQIGLVEHEEVEVDLDALTVIPAEPYCMEYFGPDVHDCFLFSVDDVNCPSYLDPGDIYITACTGAYQLFADDIFDLGLAGWEDLDALSVNSYGEIQLADPIDIDGDGFPEDIDCDDTDPSVNPGVIESSAMGNCADGVDNDCDTLIDTDPECTSCFLGSVQ